MYTNLILKICFKVILFFGVLYQVNAQNSHLTLSGRLIDSKTNEALPFASIYLKGTTIGTSSNIEGEFVFHIPPDLQNKSVVISMIGYYSVEKPVSNFKKNGIIHLEEHILSLNDVIVSNEKPLTAKQIVRKAYKSIEANYPNKPYILEGFVRDVQNEDSTYVELLEYATKIYYQSNEVKKEPQVELVELRASHLTAKHPWNKNRERQNAIIDLVEDDFIRFDYGPIKIGKGWKYEITAVLSFDNRLVYHITATKEPFSTAQFFIEVNSFAFVKIEYSRLITNGKYYKRRLSNGQQEYSYHIIFEYQEYNGKWYLKYQKEEDVWQIFNGLESNELLFTKYPKKELFINQVITKEVNQYPFEANLYRNKSVESQANPYNEHFWKYYNFPVQTKQQSKIEECLKNVEVEFKE